MIDELAFQKLVLPAGNLFLFSCFFASFIRERTARFGAVLGILLLFALLFGIRDWGVGIDTPKYTAAFEAGRVAEYHDLEIYEPLYIAAGLVLRPVLKHYNLFLLFVSFLQVLCLFLAYHRLLGRWAPFGLALYAAGFVFWLSNLSMLRQGLSIALCFYAYALLVTSEHLKGGLLLLLSPMVHFSALLWPVAYFLFRFYRRLAESYPSLFRAAVVLVVAGLAYPGPLFYEFLKFLVDQVYSLTGHPYAEKIQWYMTWSKLTPWHLKHVYFLILLLFFAVAVRVFRRGRADEHFLFLFSGLTVILFCKYDEMVADRMFMYFVPVVPVLLLKFLEEILPAERDRRLALVLVLAGAVVWFNVKFFLLQYGGWFISPFPAVR